MAADYDVTDHVAQRLARFSLILIGSTNPDEGRRHRILSNGNIVNKQNPAHSLALSGQKGFQSFCKFFIG